MHAPSFSRAATVTALRCGVYRKASQAAVVGCGSASMLSFTAKGTPHSAPRSSAGCASSSLLVEAMSLTSD